MIVSKGEYDLYLFQELWMEKDYDTIKSALPDGFHITNYHDFSDTSPKCGLQDCLPLCKFKNIKEILKYYSRSVSNYLIKYL